MAYEAKLSRALFDMQVVGAVSSWIQPDSLVEQEQRHYEAALLRELEWAAHNSLQAVLIPLPQTGGTGNYARTLLQVSWPPYIRAVLRLAVVHILPYSIDRHPTTFLGLAPLTSDRDAVVWMHPSCLLPA